MNNKTFFTNSHEEECREYAALSASDKAFLQEHLPATYTAMQGLIGKNPATLIKVVIKESKLPNNSRFEDHSDELKQMIYSKSFEMYRRVSDINENDFSDAAEHALMNLVDGIWDLRDRYNIIPVNEFCYVTTNFDMEDMIDCLNYNNLDEYEDPVFYVCVYYRGCVTITSQDDELLAHMLHDWSCAMSRRFYECYTKDDAVDLLPNMYNVVNHELRCGSIYAENNVIPISLFMKPATGIGGTESSVVEVVEDLRCIFCYQKVLVLANSTGINLNEICTNFTARNGERMTIPGEFHVGLGINERLAKCNDPVILFNYNINDGDNHYIGFIVNCDHPDALQYLTRFSNLADTYMRFNGFDSEPYSDRMVDFIQGRGQGFGECNNRKTFGYGYFSKASDIDFADYAYSCSDIDL